MKSGGEQRREVEGRRRGRRAKGKEGDGGTISFPTSSLPRRIQRSHPAGAPSPSVGGSPGRRGSRCTGSQGHGAAGPVGAVARRRGGGIVVVVVVADAVAPRRRRSRPFAVARPPHLVSFSVFSLSSLCVDAGLFGRHAEGERKNESAFNNRSGMQKRDFFPSLSNPDSRERKRQWTSRPISFPKGKAKTSPENPKPLPLKPSKTAPVTMNLSQKKTSRSRQRQHDGRLLLLLGLLHPCSLISFLFLLLIALT